MKRWIVKVLILAAVAYAMVCMWHWKIGFTYFTQLSNLFVAAVVLMGICAPGKFMAMKFAATVSILMTGITYLAILGPLEPGGILAAYAQDHYASLCMHLIVPVLTMTDFWMNDRDYPWRRKHVWMALVPPAGYLIVILIAAAAGFRWYRNMPAPYPFLNYFAPAGWFGFRLDTIGWDSIGIGVAYVIVVMLLCFIGLGFLLRQLCQRKGSLFSNSKAKKESRDG